MAILTKNQLSASNASSFPDNNQGAITPEILRNFNTSIIDTLVDSLDTGSFVTSAITGSSLVTASFSGNTLTFTKGNGTQFGVLIPDVSGSTGNFATTGSNTFVGNQTITGSINISGSINMVNGADLVTHHVRAQGSNGLELQTSNGTIIVSMGGGGGTQAGFVGALTANSVSASSFTGLGNLTTYSSSVDSRLVAEAFSSSLFATKFATIGTQSGSWGGSSINTGSFATTGSNTFNGNQIVNGYINVGGGIGNNVTQTISASTGSINLNVGSGSINLSAGTGSQSIIFLNSYLTQNKGRFSVAGPEFNVKTIDDTLVKLSLDTTGGEYTPLNLYGQYAYDSVIVNSANTASAPYAGHTIDDSANSNNNIGIIGTYIDGVNQSTYGVIFGGGGMTNNGANDGIMFRSYGNLNSVDFLKNVAITGSLNLTSTFTSSLQQGYVWVGNASGRTTTVPTSSFGSTINTGSFATTGSNSFVGKQTINNAGGIAIQLTGSLQLTGSNSNTINGQTTINVGGGNGLTINGGGLQAQGTIVSNDGIFSFNSTAPGVNVQANVQGTGSQYPGMTVVVAPELYPTDIYGGFSINTSGTPGSQTTLIGIVANSYSNEYGTTTTPMIVGGGTYNSSDTSIGFANAAIDLWKPTNVKSGLSVTGSMAGKVNSLVITGTTASLDFSLGNFFTLNLPTGSVTYINPSNIKAGQTINLQVSQSSASTGSITFAPSIKFAGGYDYTATAITGALDLVSFVAFDTKQILATSVKNLL